MNDDPTRLMVDGLKDFAVEFNLPAPAICQPMPLAVVALSTNELIIEFLYGPSEFHVVLLVIDKEDQSRYGLAELYRIPSVKAWAMAHIPKDGRTGIQMEMEWCCRFLREPCRKLFSDPKTFLSQCQK